MSDYGRALSLSFNGESSDYAHLVKEFSNFDRGVAHTDPFDALGFEIHETNVEKGFWLDPEIMDKYVAKLMLITSEVTEVMEALRKSQGADKVTEEFADILIRTLDLYSTLVEAGEADPELFKVMSDKMEANKNRAPKHGNRWG
jgi:NTP pyrophosphatase (non-canonical NTP hydrolase)